MSFIKDETFEEVNQIPHVNVIQYKHKNTKTSINMIL